MTSSASALSAPSVDIPLSENAGFFARSRLLFYALFFLLLLGGFGLRSLNLHNPPLDFHAWRQLRSATIARAMYYEMLPSADAGTRDQAINLGKRFEVLEPRIFERLVALTYLALGGERLWVPRLYSILFWTIGGAGLFALARRMLSPDAALTALAVYMFMPYGVFASRSFQPDPWMVMWVILAAYALIRWGEEQTWKWTLLAGVFSGLAVLIKVFAVYPVAAMAIAVVLSNWKLKQIIQDRRVWAAAAVMAIIPSIYYIFSVGHLATGYISGWVSGFSNMLATPRFYITWMAYLDGLFDLSVILLGLMAIFLLPRRGRAILLGLWIGYVLIGMSVPSLIITHDYYNLIVVPLAALSLAPLGDLFLAKMAQQPRLWQAFFVGAALLSIAYPAWITRNGLLSNDYRPEVLGWIKMGRELPSDGLIIGVTHDYNTRLAYYGWKGIRSWPYAADAQMNVMAGGNANFEDPVWETIFAENTADADYFLVTMHGELEAQPILKAMLEKYPSIEGQGYILYDLRIKE